MPLLIMVGESVKNCRAGVKQLEAGTADEEIQAPPFIRASLANPLDIVGAFNQTQALAEWADYMRIVVGAFAIRLVRFTRAVYSGTVLLDRLLIIFVSHARPGVAFV